MANVFLFSLSLDPAEDVWLIQQPPVQGLFNVVGV
jgi:hypothetical protein